MSTSTQAIGQVYNIGSNQEISVAALAKRVIELTNSASTVQLIPYEEAYPAGFEDMRRRIPDIKKIQKTTDFTPRYDLDRIILSIVDYQQQQASTCSTSKTG